MLVFNEEYSKLVDEKNQLDNIKFSLNNDTNGNEEKINKSIELFFIRLSLKKIILKLIGTNGIDINHIFNKLNFFSKSEETKIFKEYRDSFGKDFGFFPTFIFDDYNEIDFKKCIEYRNLGHTLSEVEKYYIDKIKNKGKVIS